jgi:hypothetical protein
MTVRRGLVLIAAAVAMAGFAADSDSILPRLSGIARRSAASAPYPGRYRPRHGGRSHGVDHLPVRDRRIDMLRAAR